MSLWRDEMEIRFPEDATERTGALMLWTGAYYSRGYVSDLQPRPLAATAEVLVAVHHGVVIGTASLVPGFREPLPTLKYFGLTQLDERPGATMEIARLAVADGTGPARGMATIGLIAAAQLWGDHNGVRLALATLKPALHRRLAMLGIACELLAGPEQLRAEATPPEYRGYLFPQSPDQRPVAVAFRLDQTRTAILGHLSAANGRITISAQIAPPLASSAPQGEPPHPAPSPAAISPPKLLTESRVEPRSPRDHAVGGPPATRTSARVSVRPADAGYPR
jgi:hypothetical protein